MPRLFVALPVPAPVRAALAELHADLDGARWIPPEQFHLTLRFVGDLGEERVPDLSAALAAVEAPRLRLLIRGPGSSPGQALGVFPHRRRPRVLVARVEPDAALTDLQRQVEAAVQALGLAPDPKPFRPHVTLARLKRPEPRTVHTYLRQHEGFAAAFEADALALYVSTLRPEGALHERVATFALG